MKLLLIPILLIITIMLYGCPPPEWNVKPDRYDILSINEKCIRSLTTNPNVLGVVKEDYNSYRIRKDYYLIETSIGIASLSIGDKPNSISLSYFGRGKNPPQAIVEKGRVILNEITAHLRQHCV